MAVINPSERKLTKRNSVRSRAMWTFDSFSSSKFKSWFFSNWIDHNKKKSTKIGCWVSMGLSFLVKSYLQSIFYTVAFSYYDSKAVQIILVEYQSFWMSPTHFGRVQIISPENFNLNLTKMIWIQPKQFAPDHNN